MTNLKQLILEIIHDYPTGLHHSDIVSNVLARGYENNSNLPLSMEIHIIVKELCKEEFIIKINNSGIREYHEGNFVSNKISVENYSENVKK